MANDRRLSDLVKRREREIDLFWDGLIMTRGIEGAEEDVTPIDVILDLP